MRRPNSDRQKIICTHFTWNVWKKNGIYWADGRGNTPKFGRYSLGTSVFAEATTTLEQLDRVKAVDSGKAPRTILDAASNPLSIAEGRSLYEKHVGRPAIAGGATEGTKKRYRAVLDKFVAFTVTSNVKSWNQVNSDVLKGYASYLEDMGRSYNTQYLELTTLKQIVKWLISESHLPDSCKISLKLPRDHETTTYCWTDEQYEAIIQHCDSITNLRWLSQVCTTLGRTGMRISELSQLRWSDINLEASLITLKDESRRTMKRQGRNGRTLKNKRGRSFPIHDEVLKTFQELGRHQDGFVFHGPKGGRLKPDTVRNFLIDHVLEPLKAQFPTDAGEIGFEHGRLHSFRHFFCSSCANSNIPERVVMTWLGHADAAMVRRY